MPRKPPEEDFNIYVDPSCMSAPMAEETAPKVAEGEKIESIDSTTTEPLDQPEPDIVEEKEDSLEAADGGILSEDASKAEEGNIETVGGREQTPDDIVETPEQVDDNVDGVEAQEPELDQTLEADQGPGDHAVTEQNEADDTAEIRESIETSELLDDSPEADLDGSQHEASREEDENEAQQEEDDEDTPRPTQILDNDDDDDADDSSSRRESDVSERRHSLRTEALIQAAARAVVKRIEKQDDRRESTNEEEDADNSILSSSSHGEHGIEGTELSYDEWSSQGRNSDAHSIPGTTIHNSDGEAADSSSQHEADDDVFSDRSPRSSLGSSDGQHDDHTEKMSDTHTEMDYRSNYGRSPRVSGISGISDLSHYEKEEFVPATRGTPRPAFRTPSSVRKLQMSSPTPSVFGSPRSSRRHAALDSGGLPTVSRLGSPTVSAQYSPKGRSTPPRFKRKEAPLVLLHVTLLPLRWPWADVLNGLDAITDNGKRSLRHFEPSEQLKNLRGAWRQLQDRVGDTVLERGILLPHPQNDYEVLEERLLEALELPLRRRARILECGHYLGPANEMTLGEDEDDSEDEYTSQAGRVVEKRHWCSTCRSEIRYDELGEGKIFRIKVYASNGLMKAGAWEACWKEMERVDVEVEPIMERDIQSELESLATIQQQEEFRRQHEEEDHIDVQDHAYLEHDHRSHIEVSSPPGIHASPIDPPATTITVDDDDLDRRRRDEERLREIYGHGPPAVHTEEQPGASAQRHPDSYIPPPSPPSPSEQAYERRESRRKTYQAASLPELLLEAGKVLMQDRKNVVIALLSVLILMLAVRTAPPEPQRASAGISETDAELLRSIYLQQQQHQDKETTVQAVLSTPSQQVQTQIAATVETPISVVPIMASVESIISSSAAASDPCVSSQVAASSSAEQVQTVKQKKVVRVYETVTETVKVTATETTVPEPSAELEEEEEEYETVVETVKVTATESLAAKPITEIVEEVTQTPDIPEAQEDVEISEAIPTPESVDVVE